VVAVLLGFLVALPFAFAIALQEGESFSANVSGWLAVIYVGLFEMGITFVLWISALKSTQNTARISNLIFISPFISLLLLAYIIGEQIHISTLAGLALIVLGLMTQQLYKNKAAKKT
jgi:drug/metabolite transporter (DMT)-like permease